MTDKPKQDMTKDNMPSECNKCQHQTRVCMRGHSSCYYHKRNIPDVPNVIFADIRKVCRGNYAAPYGTYYLENINGDKDSYTLTSTINQYDPDYNARDETIRELQLVINSFNDKIGLLENHIELLKEDMEVANMNFDDMGVPRKLGDNDYSIKGRMDLVLNDKRDSLIERVEALYKDPEGKPDHVPLYNKCLDDVIERIGEAFK